MKADGIVEVFLHSFFILTLYGGKQSTSVPCQFIPEERLPALIGEQEWWTAESCGCFGEEGANLHLPGIES